MARARAHPIINVNHERWLVSYADFITLLFAFFVVMYSVSQVDEQKQRILSQTLLEIFNQTERTLKPIQVGDPVVANIPSVIDHNNSEFDHIGIGFFQEAAQLPSANSQINSGPIDNTTSDRQFATLETQLKNRFSELVDNQQLFFKNTQYWLEIELKTTNFFASGSAEPNYAAETVFDEIGQSLQPFDNAIRIEGHTDDLPISTSAYPSNWELSAARSSTVIQLFSENGVAQQRMTAVGHGSYKSLVDNTSEANRALNRRIVIRVEKKADEESIKDRAEQFYERKNAILTAPDLNARQKNSALIELGPTPNYSALVHVLELMTGAKTHSEIIPPSDTVPLESAVIPITPVIPVVLDNGDILFTSDPNLPRN